MLKRVFTYPKISLLIIFIIGLFFVWREVLDFRPSNELFVAFLDIGQGDAIFIETPNGNQIIVDGGPDNSISQHLAKLMPLFDNSIDMIFVTNPDKDHIAGFIDVLEKYEVGAVVEPGTMPETAVYKELEKKIDEEVKGVGTKKIIARRGMDFKIDNEVHLIILFPDRDVSTFSTNDGSIVAKLVYKNTSVMLTGDTTDDMEGYLVELDEFSHKKFSQALSGMFFLDSDILKVAHHGSKTSTSEIFIKAVSPDVAVISAGENNRYGHPHEDVLGRLSKSDISTLVTFKEGTVMFKSNGEIFRRIF